MSYQIKIKPNLEQPKLSDTLIKVLYKDLPIHRWEYEQRKIRSKIKL